MGLVATVLDSSGRDDTGLWDSYNKFCPILRTTGSIFLKEKHDKTCLQKRSEWKQAEQDLSQLSLGLWPFGVSFSRE